jgi:hypothetical protein
MQKKTKIMVFIMTLVFSFAGVTLACGATEEKALSAALQAYAASALRPGETWQHPGGKGFEKQSLPESGTCEELRKDLPGLMGCP